MLDTVLFKSWCCLKGLVRVNLHQIPRYL
uniref:Uncharacterized protein n=1 Tax=Anguilla anguilla TaxID=7936 RepID=A0A0E9RGT4_ANGAN